MKKAICISINDEFRECCDDGCLFLDNGCGSGDGYCILFEEFLDDRKLPENQEWQLGSTPDRKRCGSCMCVYL